MTQYNGLKIIFILAIVYYLISSQKKIEKMSNLNNKKIEKLTNTDHQIDINEIKQEIKKEIEKQYQLDIEAIRSLSLVSEKLQTNGLTIPGNLKVTGDLDVDQKFNYLPKGSIIAFNGTKAPNGWAICDGKNGTPDLTNRFIFGSGDKKIGTKGGEETHILTVNEMPSHDHGSNTTENGDHTHKMKVHWAGKSGTGGKVFMRDNDKTTDGPDTHRLTIDGKHTHSISSQGNDASHNNMPPYYVLTYIMKL